MDDVIGFDFTYPVEMRITNGPNLWLVEVKNADIDITRTRTRADLTAYSQRDPRWKDEEYMPGATFGRYGCLVCCVAMVASTAGYTLTPPEVAEKLRQTDAFEGPLLQDPREIPKALPKLEYNGTVHWRDRAADIGILKRELRRGPVIVEVEFIPGGPAPPTDQHFVVAEHLVSNGTQDLLIADPWDGACTRLLERYALDHWDLARAIYGLRLLQVKEDEPECAI
jgi:hypothetical protein